MLDNLARYLFVLGSLACAVATTAAEESRYWIYVNGGASALSNFEVHEQNLLSFKQELFGEPFAILNAGGSKSAILARNQFGGDAYDAEGFVSLRASDLPFEQSSARRSDFIQLFETLRAKPPAQITMVLADHGSPDGIQLWEDPLSLSVSDLHQLHERLPAKTLIRSIHLHCYAGAAMVDSNRQIPTKLTEWDAFLSRYYRRNSCALALGASDEPGWYLDQIPGSQGEQWRQVLRQSQHPTLRSLKSALMDRPEIPPLILLTSDYLAEDLAEFFCRQEEAWGSRARTTPAPFANFPRGDSRWNLNPISANEANPCRRDPILGDYNLSVREWDFWYGAATTARSLAAEMFIYDHFPDKYARFLEAWQAAYKLQSEIRKKYGTLPPLEVQAKLERDIWALRQRGNWWNLRHYQMSLYRGTLDKERFARYLKSEELSASIAKTTRLSDEEKKIIAQMAKDHPDDAKQWALAGLDTAQLARRRYLTSRQERLRAFVATKLLNPRYESLRAFYFSILQCEDSSLR